MRHHVLIPAAALLAVAACREPEQFKEPQKLGGKMVDAATLNNGRVAYVQYCRTCHGDKGEGNGPASPGLRPPPRNFTLGEFKFAGVMDNKLPRDEDLVRIVKGGLHGTAMLAWDVPDNKLHEIIQYIKTLSDKWKEDDAVGEPVVLAPNPWPGKEKAAIERGKRLYHGYAQCLTCHAAYATKQEIYDASKELAGTGTTDFRDNMYQPELKDSDYGVKVLPPDFLFNELRSIHRGTDTELADVYRILVAGVTGAAMPSWNADALPNKTDDLWALAYYVKSLTDLRNTPGSWALRQQLATQAAFVPPPEPADAPAPTP